MNSSGEELLEQKIGDEDDEDFKKAFALLDVDHNGEITKVDLSMFIKAHLGMYFFTNLFRDYCSSKLI